MNLQCNHSEQNCEKGKEFTRMTPGNNAIFNFMELNLNSILTKFWVFSDEVWRDHICVLGGVMWKHNQLHCRFLGLQLSDGWQQMFPLCYFFFGSRNLEARKRRTPTVLVSSKVRCPLDKMSEYGLIIESL